MKWDIIVGTVISATLGLAMLSQVDFHLLGSALRLAQYALLLPAILATIGTLLLRAWRWQYLLEPVKPIRPFPLFSAIAIGFMAKLSSSSTGAMKE